MQIQVYRGCLALLGPEIDAIGDTARRSPILQEYKYPTFSPTRNPYHITIVSKPELRSRGTRLDLKEVLKQFHDILGSDHPLIHDLGIGRHSTSQPIAFFIVCIWAKGQKLREYLGLPPTHFHITLSYRDVHDVDKGISTLFPGQFPVNPSSELLDHLTYTLHLLGNYGLAKGYTTLLCGQEPHSEKGFLRLGDASLKLGHWKAAMLAFACAHSRCSEEGSGPVKEYCVSKITVCARETEWGTVLAEGELVQLPCELLQFLFEPWTPELRATLSEAVFTPVMQLEPRDRLSIPPRHLKDNPPILYTLPRFFRWLVPFSIAIMSTPRNAIDIAALSSPHIGICHILTLTEETPLNKEWFVGGKVKNTFLPIPNYHPPTIEQIDLMIKIIQNPDNRPILVHCGGGKGRAGTVAACYLAAFGFSPIPSLPKSEPAMSAVEAISALRAIRPGSLETPQQEAFVSKWCSTIWKRRSVFPDLVPEPPDCRLETEGAFVRESNLFILVGLPGSGKSWVSRTLVVRNPTDWTWVSQDESGSRSMCENEVGRFNGKRKMILDRCNTSKADRRDWLNLANLWSLSPVCIWLDYDKDLCISRAQNRAGHPNLPPGGRVLKAIEQMEKAFVRPTLEEGFSAIFRVRSLAAAKELVEQLSPPVTLFKFPRTEHLINLGAASSDDLVSSLSFASLSLGTLSETRDHIVITEKVDGANMGFSLSSDRTKILVQNRSHYVNPTSHEQFKKLGMWVELHREGIYQVLDRDPHFAQRYVLFGEWMAATHSVSYTQLPDWFLAFDLYDRSTRTWADRETLERVLEGTGIKMTPLIYHGPMLSEADIRNMVQLQSKYTEGRLEGVYVKWENGGMVVRRGKVVRGDFIAGNEHWTRGGIHKNQLIQD